MPGPKKERVLHRFVLRQADGDPGSFSGLVLVSRRRANLEENHCSRNLSFATIVRNYMTGEDEGCCCLTG